jgi:predicted amidohydrolase
VRLVLLQPVLEALEDGSNREAVRAAVKGVAGALSAADLLLLPEHFVFTGEPRAYDDFISEMAAIAGCTVVGGSHHRNVDGRRINYGAVVSPGGTRIAHYSKLRPYFNEQNHVVPGDAFGEFSVAGRNVLVLVCADFWYSDLVLAATTAPDLILVPALSVSRKPEPEFSRSLWRHLAVARAYEFGAYVGISDWDARSVLPKYRTCGVAGLADPTPSDPGNFFTPVPSGEAAAVYDLDFAAVEAFRDDRRMRGFFWK